MKKYIYCVYNYNIKAGNSENNEKRGVIKVNFQELKWLCKEIIKFYENKQKNEKIPKPEREGITNLRIQKILFFLYGFYWKEKQEEIITIEFEAWQHGPVIKELYNFLIEDSRLGQNRYNPLKLEWFEESIEPTYDLKTFKKILNYLGQFSTIKLVNASHDTEPWLKTPNLSIIDKELIKKWFDNDVPEIK